MEKITPIELHYLFAVISWRLRRTTNRDEEFHLEKIKEKLHKLTEQSSGNPAVELSVNFEQELDKAREEERKRMIKAIESMKHKGDIEEFKHIKTTLDCKTVEEYIWFIGSMTLNRVLSKLKDNK